MVQNTGTRAVSRRWLTADGHWEMDMVRCCGEIIKPEVSLSSNFLKQRARNGRKKQQKTSVGCSQGEESTVKDLPLPASMAAPMLLAGRICPRNSFLFPPHLRYKCILERQPPSNRCLSGFIDRSHLDFPRLRSPGLVSVSLG